MKNLIVTLALILISVGMANAQITPTVVLKTSLPVGSEISIAIGTRNDTTIQIDWGNGILLPYGTHWSNTQINNTLAGNTIKIYGSTIHNFAAADVEIDTADFSGCLELTDLLIQNCGMSSINISENNKLLNCWIPNNKLKNLDLKNDTSLYTLRCDNNQLTTLDIRNSGKLHELGLNYNQFSSIDLTHNPLLFYLDCSQNQFKNIDITKNTLLDFFNCGDNKISTIDVSKNTALTYLHCYKNPLQNIDVSQNVKMAYSDMSDTQLEHIDLSSNTELLLFYCMNNTLLDLDLSKNNKLERVFCQYGTIGSLNLGNVNSIKELYCYNNKLNELDVSKVEALDELRCNNNQITSIDISKNNQLIWLYCFSNKITSLTLPANSKFMVLDCRYNLLTNIDVSKSTGLKYFRCIDNKLTTLDLSANDSLVHVKCDSNYLTIASLPLKESRWTTYLYFPQKKLMLSKKQYETYETIDLSNQVSREGKSTGFSWKTLSGNTLIEGTDYAVSTGVFAFLKPQTDSVYCEIRNETFPDLILETSRFMVFTTTRVNESSVKTTVFPNPCSENVRVESVEPIHRIEIFSVTGKKLSATELNGLRSVELPVSNLPKGTLILKIYGKGYSFTRKLIKN
ncbi:MAG TPA: T9SS type A sorting domain-containing protein [Bacteroidales bacterium]|nr:T9SS type A sorting domain-containing protein [Bacteroidales bacterium]